MAGFSSLGDILSLNPVQYPDHWGEFDAVIAAMPREQQEQAWRQIVERIGSSEVSRGFPFFRIGILKLLADIDAAEGLRWLEAAYAEDQRYGPKSGQLSHRMRAYRLLSLVRDYFRYLNAEKNWQHDLLLPANWRIVVQTLLIVYDRSLVEIFDMPSYSYDVFFSLIRNRDLCAFAIENYYCAGRLIQAFSIEGQLIINFEDEYPLARAIVGLLAGVLEAILLERLPDLREHTLGRLLRDAHTRGILRTGTKFSTLASFMLHMRNYIHADLGSQRADYFIDINTAKGCKAALDWGIAELLPR